MRQEPIILAVETSSRLGSVALAFGAHLRAESTFSGPLRHSAEIFPTIGQLLDDHDCTPADVDQIHISIGPGSFTGLRIAVTIAKTMHLAAEVRIVTVDSLDVVAANVCRPRTAWAAPAGPKPGELPLRIATLFDAKRSQFYAAVYERRSRSVEPIDDGAGYAIAADDASVWHKNLGPGLITADELAQQIAGEPACALLGDGLLYHHDAMAARGLAILDRALWSPTAAAVFQLGYQKAIAGRFADPLTLAPAYIRDAQVTLRNRP